MEQNCPPKYRYASTSLNGLTSWRKTLFIIIVFRTSDLKKNKNILKDLMTGIRDSAVGIATGCGLNDGAVEVRVPVGSRIFSSPRRSDRLWGSPGLLFNGYRGLFPRG
jgi:hypothetical protein